MKCQMILGKRALLEVFRSDKERILEVFTGNDPVEFQKMGMKARRVNKQLLLEMAGTEHHQGVVARVVRRPSLPLSSFFDKQLLLALDGVIDPQNMGAILRTAEGFGVEGVIWSRNRCCGMTPAVSKASAGASEVIPFSEVSNLAEALRTLKDEGFSVAVADMGGDEGVNFPDKLILVMGSEEKGVQPLIRKMADWVVGITMRGQISSLNVSVATAVFLDRYCSRIK
ncbi:MAG: 23S rRNA (guanosine(2251)-2'-O)-methyltransferase RlmB [Simkaniaceae bacterium]|nr:23S rRNA (guanosine(2251)-2'-O)-methyltransferase RlmB [Simkaniaceae bacterium]